MAQRYKKISKIKPWDNPLDKERKVLLKSEFSGSLNQSMENYKGRVLTRETTMQNTNNTPLTLQSLYGDGSDGNVVLTGNTTLTRDMFYRNLEIRPGVTLNTGGYRVFVRENLTGEGTIARNGANGNNGSDGASQTGGAGGAAPSGLADGTVKGSVAGSAGGAGVDGYAFPAGS